jgi:hypothetical protein
MGSTQTVDVPDPSRCVEQVYDVSAWQCRQPAMPKPARTLRAPASAAARAMTMRQRTALVPLASSPASRVSPARVSPARMAARHRRSERNLLALCAACVLAVCTLTVFTIVREQSRDRLSPVSPIVAPLQP